MPNKRKDNISNLIDDSSKKKPKKDVEEKKRDAAVNSIGKALENFTTDFYKRVAGETSGNFVCSPVGVHTVLSMVAYGAADTTAQALRNCLHLPKDDDLALQGFQNILNQFDVSYPLPFLRKIFEEDESDMDVILKVINKIYTSTKVTVKDEFQEIATTYFHSKNDSVDFEKRDKSAKIINNWCSENTCGKISQIVSADEFKEESTQPTMMILLNAVYFKCYWQEKFDEGKTEIKPFYINKIDTINVPMMHKTSDFYYTQLKDVNAQCIALPYNTIGENVSIEIIIPNDIDGLKNIENNFEKINQIKFEKQHYISLSLPKFKIETELDLQNHLSKMGLAEMFSDEANFKNMFDELTLKLFKPIKVKKVLQKTFVEINEKGTEAASITYVRCVGGGFWVPPPPPMELKVNRPFLYKIMYNNYTLFVGRITNPLENKSF